MIEEDPSSTVTSDENGITVTYKGYSYIIDDENNIIKPENSVVDRTDRAEVVIIAPVIGTEINAGEQAIFSVMASGPNLTYQWYVNTYDRLVGGEAIPNATSSTYVVEDTSYESDSNGKYFYCEITSTYNGKTAKKKSPDLTPARLVINDN